MAQSPDQIFGDNAYRPCIADGSFGSLSRLVRNIDIRAVDPRMGPRIGVMACVSGMVAWTQRGVPAVTKGGRWFSTRVIVMCQLFLIGKIEKC